MVSTAHEQHVLVSDDYRQGNPERLYVCCLLWGRQEFVNARAEYTLQESRGCRADRQASSARRATCREPLQVADAECPWLTMVTGEPLGILGELLERLLTLPDQLFEQSAS
ncbi:hypothetical protein [Amycolatopsis sp. GM8]|uniref:hypothetical protein n=1 Tax=Amycolatopsis sp. GM8 TaxID=2896530 RepID=UPI001F196600|nr:hypothetical protein [Amycolatopsis sp. GM8]